MAISVYMAVFLSAGAAWMDLRRARVANSWLLCWLMLSLAVQLHDTGPPAMRQILPGMILPIVLLFPFFFFRMLGAGDIKVLAVLGSLMGARTILICTFLSFLLGAGYALLLLLEHGGFIERLSYFLTYIQTYRQTGQKQLYRQTGEQAETLCMTVPMFLAVLLWAGGLY